jgi:hypothetical protein
MQRAAIGEGFRSSREHCDMRAREPIAANSSSGLLYFWNLGRMGVDLLSVDRVKVYRASDPSAPTVYQRGELAEPAVPGWCLTVDARYA